MVGFPRARAHARDTESMMTVTVAGTERAVEVFELEVEVSLTASARSLVFETIMTTAANAANAANAMTATGIMTAIVTTIAMTVANVVTGAEIADARIMDIRSMRSMTIIPTPVLSLKDHLSFSVGGEPRKEGTTKAWSLKFGRQLATICS